MHKNTTSALHELRELLDTPNHAPAQRMRIAELFHIIDTECSHGGRLPDDWADAIRPQVREPRQTHNCVPCGTAHSLPLCVGDISEA